MPVLDLPPTKRIGGIVASLNRVHDSLRTPAVVASPLARNLREEIEAFPRTPAASLTTKPTTR